MPQKKPFNKYLRSGYLLLPQEISAFYLNFYPTVIATEKMRFLHKIYNIQYINKIKNWFEIVLSHDNHLNILKANIKKYTPPLIKFS